MDGQMANLIGNLGNLCGMEGFGWRRRESGKKLNVMSGYEWLRVGAELGKKFRKVRQSELGTRVVLD